jgi:ADP-ribose pyrophosphatase YjhB (NUDIX family)
MRQGYNERMNADIRTRDQISAGGVAYRKVNDKLEVVLISVGEQQRWQLPKGRVGKGESSQAAAQREVREEAGVETVLEGELDTIDYWFYAGRDRRRIRIHKYVHFYLMRYLTGDPSQHDQEVNEARWYEIDQALEMLSFTGEREVLQKARDILLG